MFVFHIVTVLFLATLFCNVFGADWAHDLLVKLITTDKWYIQLILPISLVISFVSIASEAISSVDDEPQSDESSATPLTEAQKQKITEAVKKSKTDSGANAKPLSNIIGLAEVKKQVEDLKSFIVAQEKRRVVGLPTQYINLHLVFTGNPGTGKTTVAREIAKIYKQYGILKKGHLVETDRSGLVSEYLGQTAIKTKDIIEKSMGGVLFIDETYSLLGDQYGKEAIDTLLKEMEDKKGKFAVIAAGYPAEMERFINSNPGLKSRFSKTINFSDYSPTELLQIFELFCNQEGYKLMDEARNMLADIVISHAPIGERGFGNGRYVRNLFENVILKQSERTSRENLKSSADLQMITPADVKVAFSETN